MNFKLFIPFFTTLLLFSCTGIADKNEKEAEIDPNNSINTNFDGKIFSIPSPIQMALLLKETQIPFSKGLLNDVSKSKAYTTEYKQALNLGVYGTDLGYNSINEQNGLALTYLNTVEGLTTKLGLESAFDKDFMSRFQKYHTEKDSVIRIISDAFRKGDNFLKNSKRKGTSALILAGGWIESMHFACKLNEEKETEQLSTRIGEQQQSLASIIEILSEYNVENSNNELLNLLVGLQAIYKKVIIDYEFKEPITDEEAKTTTLKHTTSVRLNKTILESIYQKVDEIRTNITN